MKSQYSLYTIRSITAVAASLVLMTSGFDVQAISFTYVLDAPLPPELSSFSATLEGDDVDGDSVIEALTGEISSLSISAGGTLFGGGGTSWDMPLTDDSVTPIFGLSLPSFGLNSNNEIGTHSGGLKDSVTDLSILLRGDDFQITDEMFSFSSFVDGHWESAAVPDGGNTLILTGLGLMSLLCISGYVSTRSVNGA
jgi:hypothetical protein